MEGLNIEVLKRWLTTTANSPLSKPKLVVLSACQSRSLGNIFVEHGKVPHVICAASKRDDQVGKGHDDDDDDDDDLHEEYSMEFSKVLYRHLLSGSTVQQAFDAATLQANAYKQFEGQAGFCLLPENSYHDVELLDACELVNTDEDSTSTRTGPTTSQQHLPAPPLWIKDELPGRSELAEEDTHDDRKDNSPRDILKRSGAIPCQHSAAVRYNGGLYFAGKSTGNHASMSPVHFCSPSTIQTTPVRNNLNRIHSPRGPGKMSLPSDLSSLSPPSSPLESDAKRITHPQKELATASEMLTIQRGRTQKHLSPPSPPDFYVRHDNEMYNVIQAINAARIVWITGTDGVGKRTLVQASCSYLQDRSDLNRLDGILWSHQIGVTDGESSASMELSGLLDTLESIRREEGRSVLIVIDAKRLPEGTRSMLGNHLQHLVEKDPGVKLVVIHHEQDKEQLRIGHFPCVELSLTVEKLNLESTVKLFGTFCQYVFSNECPGIMCPESLWMYMAPPTPTECAARNPHQQRLNPQQQPFSQYSLNSTPSSSSFVPSTFDTESSTLLPKRHQVIFRLLGDGFPKQIIQTAKTITKHDFDKIIFLGGFRELDATDCHSHNGLLSFQVDVARAIVGSIRKGLYDQSSNLQLKYDCIALVKNEVKSLMTLRNDLVQIQRDISKARKEKDMHRVMHLFKEQRKVWKLLQVEVDAILKTTTPFQVSKPEILDKCHAKQTLMETALVHVQDILVDAVLCPHLHVLFGEPGSENDPNKADTVLREADRLLLKAKMGHLQHADIPKSDTALVLTLASYVEKHRLTAQSVAGSQKDVQGAAILIQTHVRRYQSRRKVEWLRVFRDLAERRRIKTRKREVSRANNRKTPLLTILEEERFDLLDRQNSIGRRCAPVRSTQENNRSQLRSFFADIVAQEETSNDAEMIKASGRRMIFIRNEDSIGRGCAPLRSTQENNRSQLAHFFADIALQEETAVETTKAGARRIIVTRHERSRRRIIQRRCHLRRPAEVRVEVDEAPFDVHPFSERIRLKRLQKKDEEDPTVTTVASTIVSSRSSDSIPSTQVVPVTEKKKKCGKSVLRPFSDWKSPLDFLSGHSSHSAPSVSACESTETLSVLHTPPVTPSSLASSEHRPTSSIMLSSSFSESSLDITLDASARTVRFCERQSSLDSTDSWWKLGPDAEQDFDTVSPRCTLYDTSVSSGTGIERRRRRDYSRYSRKGKRHESQSTDVDVDRRWETGCSPSSRIMPLRFSRALFA
jgi:hypothetical protein